MEWVRQSGDGCFGLVLAAAGCMGVVDVIMYSS